MHINLYLIPFIIILGVLLGMKDSQKNRSIYIIICSLVLVFVAAMRSPEWMTSRYGIDTLNYKGYFDQSFDMDWNELWQSIIMRYMGFENEADIGYIGLNKVIGLLTHDFNIFSLIADLLFFIPFGLILYRYCSSMRQIIFAFVFYIALVQVYLFGGARQIFAMGFDMMALLALTERRKLLMVLFFLVGVSIHFSSILFLLPLLLIWLRTKPSTLKLLHFLSFLLFPIVLMMPNEIISFMGKAVGMERYSAYGEGVIQGGASTFIILIEALSLLCLIAIKLHDIKSNQTLLAFYVMAPLFTLFAPLINSNGSMTRIALYYYLFLSLLTPYAIDCMFRMNEHRLRGLAYVVVIGALSFLTVSGGGMVYYFYWQV